MTVVVTVNKVIGLRRNDFLETCASCSGAAGACSVLLHGIHSVISH